MFISKHKSSNGNMVAMRYLGGTNGAAAIFGIKLSKYGYVTFAGRSYSNNPTMSYNPSYDSIFGMKMDVSIYDNDCFTDISHTYTSKTTNF